MKRMAKQCLVGLWVCTLLAGAVQAQDSSGGTARVSDLPGELPPVADSVAAGPQYNWFQVTPVERWFAPRAYANARAGVLYGYEESFTNVGAFLPYLRDENELLFLDASGMVTYDGRGGASVGAGWRYYMADIQCIFGLSAWYDFDAGHIRSYNQIGLSAESLGRYFDWRANGYLPVGNDQNAIATGLTGNVTFVGNRLLVERATLLETAFTGFDTEVGGPMPFLGRYGLNGYVGFYFYTANNAGDFTGVSGRLTWQVNEDTSIGVQMTDDADFGSNAQIQVSMYLPDGKPGRWLRPLSVRDRLMQRVIRNPRVTVETETKFTTELGINPKARRGDPNDLDPYFIVHVNPNGADGVASGDGTAENPYNLLSQFDNLPFADKSRVDIVFVTPRDDGTSINLNTGVTLLSMQRLLGTGIAQSVQVAQQLGVDIPLSNGALSGTLARLTNDGGGNVVTLADGAMMVEVSGFNINGSATGSGIVGSNNTAVSIHRNVISGGQNGIYLANLSGLVADDMHSHIDRNIIRGNVNDGLVIDNIAAAPLDLLVTRNAPTDVDLDGDGTFDSLDGDANFSNDGIVSNGGSGLRVNAIGSTITMLISENQFRGNLENGVTIGAGLGSVVGGVIADNVVTGQGNDGIQINSMFATVDFGAGGNQISGNTFRNNQGDGIEINAFDSTLTMWIRDNTFGDPNTAGSGNGRYGINYSAFNGTSTMVIGGPAVDVNGDPLDGNTFAGNLLGGIAYNLSGNNVTETNIENNTIVTVAAGGGGLIRTGFNEFTLAANDDLSTGLTQIGFTLNFFGQVFNSLFVNNNGNVTFNQPLFNFTPFPIVANGIPMIAPFFADVDTRLGNVVTYGTEVINGRNAFGVDWIDVRHFSVFGANAGLPTNSFQLVLIDRSDIAPGDFDIEFNYQQIQWEAGEASGSNPFGLGGFSARAGYTNGVNRSFELPGSGVNGAFLDSGPAATSLVNNSINSPILGRYVFEARNGSVTQGPPATISNGISITLNDTAQLINSTIINNTVSNQTGFALSITTNDFSSVTDTLIADNTFINNGGGIQLIRNDSSLLNPTLLNNTVTGNTIAGLDIQAGGTGVGGLILDLTDQQFNQNGGSGMRVFAFENALVNITGARTQFDNNGGNGILIETVDSANVSIAFDNVSVTGNTLSGLNALARGDSQLAISINSPFDALVPGGSTFSNNGINGFLVAAADSALAVMDIDSTLFTANGEDGLNFERRDASLVLVQVANSTITRNGDDGIQFYATGSALNDPDTPQYNPITLLAPESRLVLYNNVIDENGTLGTNAPNGGNGLEVATFADSYLIINAESTTFVNNFTDGVRLFAKDFSSIGNRETGERSTFNNVILSENGSDGFRAFVQGNFSSVPTALIEISSDDFANSTIERTLAQDNGDDGIQGTVVYGNLDMIVRSGANPADPRTLIQRNGQTTGANGHGIEFNVGDAALDNDDTQGPNSVAQFFFPFNPVNQTYWQMIQPASQPITAVGNLTVLSVVAGDENLSDTINNGNAGDGIHVHGGIAFNTLAGAGSLAQSNAVAPNYSDRFLLGSSNPGLIAGVAISLVPVPVSQLNVVIDDSDTSLNGVHGINFQSFGGQTYLMGIGGALGGTVNDFVATQINSSTPTVGGRRIDGNSIGPSVQINAVVTNNRIEQNAENGLNIELTGRHGTSFNGPITNTRISGNSFFIDNNLIQRNQQNGVYIESNAAAQDFVRVDFQDPQPTSPTFPYNPNNIGGANPFQYNAGFASDVFLSNYLDVTADLITDMVFTNNVVRYNGSITPLANYGDGVFIRVSTDSYLSLDFGGEAGSGNGNTFYGNTLADFHTESFIQYQARPDLPQVQGVIARVFETPPQSIPGGAPTADIIFLDHTAQMDLRFNNTVGSKLAVPFVFGPTRAAIYTVPDGAANSGKGPGSRAVQIFQVDDGFNLDANNFWSPIQNLTNEFASGNYHLRTIADPLFPNTDFPQNWFRSPGDPFLP